MESLTRSAAGVVLAALAASATVNGTFSLLGGKQQIYARAIISEPHPDQVTFDITESKTQGGPPIRNYDLDMSKLMHLIAISDDFKQFIHLHPSFNRKTGIFRQAIPVDPAHAYTIYVDSTPKGIGQQVFRFALPAPKHAASSAKPLPPSTPSPTTMNAGPYAVKIEKTTLASQTMLMVPLDITKDGKPATDLQPYLGAAGHAVFVDTATLAYVHVHPMVRAQSSPAPKASMQMNDEHGAGVAGPHLMMHIPALPVGTYKLWFQFRGAGKLYVAPFTLAVR
jgi:hypothetical protein